MGREIAQSARERARYNGGSEIDCSRILSPSSYQVTKPKRLKQALQPHITCRIFMAIRRARCSIVVWSNTSYTKMSELPQRGHRSGLFIQGAWATRSACSASSCVRRRQARKRPLNPFALLTPTVAAKATNATPAKHAPTAAGERAGKSGFSASAIRLQAQVPAMPNGTASSVSRIHFRAAARFMPNILANRLGMLKRQGANA